MSLRRWLVGLGAAALLGVGLGEAGLRLVGSLDLPLFRTDPRIGYYPAPAQHGAYLRRNAWVFNERSMGTARAFRPTADSILLLGDSIVYGGNPLNQPDKLGPQLEQHTRRPVYPLAAGGWAFDNELQMLRANPDLLAVPTLVVVANSGDFGEVAGWSSPINWPVARPLSAIDYNLRKFIFKPHDVVQAPTSEAATRQWQADLDWLLAHYKGRLVWVLYPAISEVHKPLPASYGPLLERIKGRATVVNIHAAPEWSTQLYRDGAIHPNALGDAVLAGLIAKAL